MRKNTLAAFFVLPLFFGVIGAFSIVQAEHLSEPVLLSPSDGATMNEADFWPGQDFFPIEWETVSGATHYHLEIRAASDAGSELIYELETPFFVPAGQAVGDARILFIRFPESGTYAWRMHACTSGNCSHTGDWSEWRTVTVLLREIEREPLTVNCESLCGTSEDPAVISNNLNEVVRVGPHPTTVSYEYVIVRQSDSRTFRSAPAEVSARSYALRNFVDAATEEDSFVLHDGERYYWSVVARDSATDEVVVAGPFFFVVGEEDLSPDPDPSPGPGPLGGDFWNPLPYDSFIELLFGVLNFLLALAIFILPIIIVIGGFMWMTAAGDPGRVSKGRTILTWGIIGFVVVLLSRGLIEVIMNTLGADFDW